MLAGAGAYGFGESNSDKSAEGGFPAWIAVRPGLYVEGLHDPMVAGARFRGVSQG